MSKKTINFKYHLLETPYFYILLISEPMYIHNYDYMSFSKKEKDDKKEAKFLLRHNVHFWYCNYNNLYKHYNYKRIDKYERLDGSKKDYDTLDKYIFEFTLRSVNEDFIIKDDISILSELKTAKDELLLEFLLSIEEKQLKIQEQINEQKNKENKFINIKKFLEI